MNDRNLTLGLSRGDNPAAIGGKAHKRKVQSNSRLYLFSSYWIHKSGLNFKMNFIEKKKRIVTVESVQYKCGLVVCNQTSFRSASSLKAILS